MRAGIWSDDDEPSGTAANADGSGAPQPSKEQHAKTKRDRAREARRRVQELAAAEKAALKAQRRNIDNAKQLQAEVERESEERRLRRERREVRLRLASFSL